MTMKYAFVQLMGGSASEQVIAELVKMGTSKETAQDIVSRAITMIGDARMREIAAKLRDQKKSEAETWEALVASGVEQRFAEAFVRAIVERRSRHEETLQRQAREADWHELRKGQKEARRKLAIGIAALLTVALEIVVSLLIKVNLLGWLTVGLVVGGMYYAGRGAMRLRQSRALEMHLNRIGSGQSASVV
jgi:hypothetical protein